MGDLTSITLLAPHRVLGSMKATDAQCSIHKGVADDLVKRKIAKLTKTAKNEPTESKSKGDGGK